ncbi:hypothetical protein INT45_001520 [Circinella minor]|uniref:Uncharacterized protein n=1 Tax=Circinella minor TaxID=1195481 RepID=A0A8H7S9U9_9FUNG|nr:hypothetical protein INT45_001520 [Circinella minor]
MTKKWDPVECLKNNFENEEPVLDFFFFRAGNYTIDQRTQAEREFIKAIGILVKRVNDNNNNNNNVETCAKGIMMKGFNFLDELDEFWVNIALTLITYKDNPCGGLQPDGYCPLESLQGSFRTLNWRAIFFEKSKNLKYSHPTPLLKKWQRQFEIVTVKPEVEFP